MLNPREKPHFPPVEVAGPDGVLFVGGSLAPDGMLEAERRAIWAATEGEGAYNAIVRLLWLTGQRKGEVGGMMRSERDLDKAICHGLSHAPVKAVMGPGPATCTEDEPLGELQQLLSQSHGGRVPVVRDGDVVGVVTRGDLLRALG